MQKRLPLGLIVVIAIVGIEALAVSGAAAFLLIEIIAGQSKSFVTAISLFALVAAAAVWVGNILAGLARNRRWSRSGAFFWQLIQLSIGTASFSGQFANWAIGLALIVPSLIVCVLLLTKPVVAATQESSSRD